MEIGTFQNVTMLLLNRLYISIFFEDPYGKWCASYFIPYYTDDVMFISDWSQHKMRSLVLVLERFFMDT